MVDHNRVIHYKSFRIPIIYQDDDLIAINKPHGLAVHRSKMVGNTDEFALQAVRDAIEKKVFLCHRLDRKTSGVLLFALSSDKNAEVQNYFQNRQVQKKYSALVRGYVDDQGTIDYEIEHPTKGFQNAVTQYKCLERFEMPWPQGKFLTSRYSLLELSPLTGRFHQIRKHMNHIRHPIIGDRPHGCNKQNRLWKRELGLNEMLLHAEELCFVDQSLELTLKASKSSIFNRVLSFLKCSKNR